MRFRTLVVALALLVGALAPARAADPENTVYMDLPAGRVVIALEPNLAPKTVAHFKDLVRKGFYDGLAFHRVIPGFMAQGGDPRGDGTGGSGHTVPAEFSQGHFVRGTVGLARGEDPDSGDSQFFICFAPAPFLDGKYTIFGQVVSGMKAVDALKAGDGNINNGMVVDPDHIIRIQMAADAEKQKSK
jgi:peptidylprolyl isomerase